MSVNSDTSRAGHRRPGIGQPPSRGAKVAGILLTGIWLVYLISPIADLVTSHGTGTRPYSVPYIAGGLAIIAAFCVLYLVLVPSWMRYRRYTLPGLGLLVLRAGRRDRAVDLPRVGLRAAGQADRLGVPHGRRLLPLLHPV
jgi:hypothetical protein